MVHHFMSTQEVRLSGFLDTQTGIVLGKERTLHEPLVENSRENVLLAGPAPLEKFHSVLYPTALAWKGSAFFLDTPDGMLYASTAGKRREKFQQETFLFRLSDDASVRWNPLDEIRWETWEEEEDAKCVASAILETSEVPFAYSTYALKLLPAVFRYLYAVRDGEAPVTLQGAYAFFRQADEGFLSMRYVPQVSDAAAFYRGLETYEKEQLKDLLLAVLEPFQKEEVSKAFSSSDFSLRSLLDPQHPFSLYLALDTENPMVCRFFIQLALELFTNREPRSDQNPEPHLLISLDARIWNFRPCFRHGPVSGTFSPSGIFRRSTGFTARILRWLPISIFMSFSLRPAAIRSRKKRSKGSAGRREGMHGFFRYPMSCIFPGTRKPSYASRAGSLCWSIAEAGNGKRKKRNRAGKENVDETYYL